MILLTTSRRPSRRIRTLCKDLARSVPKIVRINRGKLSQDRIAERAVELNADRIVVIDRLKWGPGKIKLFRLEPAGLKPVPPLMYIADIRLQKEFETKTPRVRSLVVTTTPENPPETMGTAKHLSDFLNLSRFSANQVATKYQASMHISINPRGLTQITCMLLPQMVEIGPRITLSRIVWEVVA